MFMYGLKLVHNDKASDGMCIYMYDISLHILYKYRSLSKTIMSDGKPDSLSFGMHPHKT